MCVPFWMIVMDEEWCVVVVVDGYREDVGVDDCGWEREMDSAGGRCTLYSDGVMERLGHFVNHGASELGRTQNFDWLISQLC